MQVRFNFLQVNTNSLQVRSNLLQHTYHSLQVRFDLLQLIIEDDGPGFPATEIQSVFDKFYRLRNTATGGTGLGLSIVKGFTEALGGAVSLRNGHKTGAIFTIEIPAETSYLKNLNNE